MNKQKNVRLTVVIIAWVVSISLLVCGIWLCFFDKGYAEVNFLSIGQGDSCVITTAKNRTVVIDGGDSDGGKYTLVPFLKKQGIRHIDSIFVSHMHSDHMFGILELLDENIDISHLYVSSMAKYSDKYKKLADAANRKGIAITELKDGDVLWVDDIKFTVLASEYKGSDKMDENDSSLILRFDMGENSILYTGDATKYSESRLHGDTNLDVDILKVGHHGSSGSSGKEFIGETSPDFSVISVGKNNKYMHPSAKTLKTLKSLDVPALRTDTNGTVTVKMTNNDILDIKCSNGY